MAGERSAEAGTGRGSERRTRVMSCQRISTTFTFILARERGGESEGGGEVGEAGAFSVRRVRGGRRAQPGERVRRIRRWVMLRLNGACRCLRGRRRVGEGRQSTRPTSPMNTLRPALPACPLASLSPSPIASVLLNRPIRCLPLSLTALLPKRAVFASSRARSDPLRLCSFEARPILCVFFLASWLLRPSLPYCLPYARG
jgi:hypothetical protein